MPVKLIYWVPERHIMRAVDRTKACELWRVQSLYTDN